MDLRADVPVRKAAKGRYRHYQFNVEALGYEGLDVDAELIMMSARMWRELGISKISLEQPWARPTPGSVIALLGREKSLDQDSIRRLERNPLRILDSKNPEMQGIIEAAPVTLDYLDTESRSTSSNYEPGWMLHAGYTLNLGLSRPRLLQSHGFRMGHGCARVGAVCSGGRYDGLVESSAAEPRRR